MKVELKNVKHNRALSEETQCFSASVYVDGKKIGTVRNAGHGGSDEHRWDDYEAGKLLEQYVRALPPTEYNGQSIPMDLEIFLGDLLNEHLHRKDLQRLCRNALVFRLKGDEPDTWRCLKYDDRFPWTRERKAALEAQFGERLERIANQELHGDPQPLAAQLAKSVT